MEKRITGIFKGIVTMTGHVCGTPDQTRDPLYEPGIHTVTFTGRYEDVTRKYNVFLQEMTKDYGRNFQIIVQSSVPTYTGESTRVVFTCW